MNAFYEQLEENGLKQFKIITENENYGIWAKDMDDAEEQAEKLCFPNAFDDDLPDLMETIEIVEL